MHVHVLISVKPIPWINDDDDGRCINVYNHANVRKNFTTTPSEGFPEPSFLTRAKLQDFALNSVKLMSCTCINVSNDATVRNPKRRPGMSDVSPLSRISGLSFDSSVFIVPVLSCSSAESCFCLVLSLLLVHFLDFFFPENLIFFNKRRAFWYSSCLAARR